MSSTKTVREACDHGRYDKHMWSGPKTIETNQRQPMDWCRGGKEMVLRPADPYPTQPGRTRYYEVVEVGERYEIVFDADGKTLAEVEDLFFNLGKADAE